MFTTLEEFKAQLNLTAEDTSEDSSLTRIINAVTEAIKNYVNRDFSEYYMPGEEYEFDPETELVAKERLPYDVEDACIMWAVYRYQMGTSMNVASERIDGLGQKTYTSAESGGRMLPAPAGVLALLNPYRYFPEVYDVEL